MSDYRIGPLGIGTAEGTIATAIVTGVASEFLSQFQAGDAFVFINADDTHDLYTVLSVASDVSLTLTANMTKTYTALDYYGLRDADALVVFAGSETLPTSVPALGAERVAVGSGGKTWRGYPRATWQWAGMTVAQLQFMKDYILGGRESGDCYVRTRDQADVWKVREAVVVFPDTAQLTRWDGMYQAVALELVLLETVI